MQEVGDRVREVKIRKDSGVTFGEDGPINLLYLAVVCVHLDGIVTSHRNVSKKTAEIYHLERQLREAVAG